MEGQERRTGARKCVEGHLHSLLGQVWSVSIFLIPTWTGQPIGPSGRFLSAFPRRLPPGLVSKGRPWYREAAKTDTSSSECGFPSCRVLSAAPCTALQNALFTVTLLHGAYSLTREFTLRQHQNTDLTGCTRLTMNPTWLQQRAEKPLADGNPEDSAPSEMKSSAWYAWRWGCKLKPPALGAGVGGVLASREEGSSYGCCFWCEPVPSRLNNPQSPVAYNSPDTNFRLSVAKCVPVCMRAQTVGYCLACTGAGATGDRVSSYQENHLPRAAELASRGQPGSPAPNTDGVLRLWLWTVAQHHLHGYDFERERLPYSQKHGVLDDADTSSLGTPTTKSPGTTTRPGDPAAPTSSSTNTSPAPSGSRVTTTTAGDQKGVQGLGQTTGPTTATVPAVSSKPAITTSQDEKKDTAPSGTQSSHKAVTTEITTTKGGSQTTPPTPTVVSTTGAPPAVPSSSTPAGSQHVPTASSAPGSSPTGSPPSRSPDVMTGHTTSQGPTNTPTTALSVTSAGNQQTPVTMTAVTGTTHAVTGITPSVPGASPSIAGTSPSIPGTLPPTVSPSGPVTPPPVRPTSSSTQLAPTAPQDSNTSFPTSALKDEMIKCESPKRLNETMLILNLTKTDLCAGRPSDNKLATLLCQAAKANFDSSRDQCRIWLVPASDAQAVAIKEVIIQTKLLPKDVYELLKDRWDDLREVGVSNMQLGNQGPPEVTEDRFSMPLITTIVCMASFLLLVAALYGCCHQRLSHRKDQQRLTEELQTVENGYHDNPTLEVMETSSEMQEKKVVNLNGELGDSWIVPLDNLMKDDLDEEEDTHL
ncbi:podocalyxin [Sturnira hondurensis]|uniref:podocalyxin n=1 Tax=Sturnira hondurensis TaxID=192404 RepID=UPI001879E1A1|nr:podocalyxin [Sturnira hondurensis]